ncbi:hypothetical protein [Bacillus amyloliquefaciens]|uniref:Uncharacterized protein n=1 Tax=Bacillus amyloliquefaciens TaxID=1390 RepID=A0AAP4DGJ4_BACAM|nr:hypothetical protein [Bacillus amyloliquefaciens]MDF4192358.1 hypothetical protein [Bacillus amyloliquefaciens]MDF4212037.1 hypothetical protein [Bacillus amyloliquefaciens]
MKMKKTLAGSALSLALLCSAAPAFAAGPADTPSAESKTKEVSALATFILNGSGPDSYFNLSEWNHLLFRQHHLPWC